MDPLCYVCFYVCLYYAVFPVPCSLVILSPLDSLVRGVSLCFVAFPYGVSGPDVVLDCIVSQSLPSMRENLVSDFIVRMQTGPFHLCRHSE